MESSGESKDDSPALLWRPKSYCHPPPGLPYAAVLLNKGVSEVNLKNVLHWWRAASVRVCVDGATNSFHHLMYHQQEEPATTASTTIQSTPSPPPGVHPTPPHPPGVHPTPSPPPAVHPTPCPLPDVISGDFDSIRPDLLKFYGAKGIRIVPTPDQNETDFTKALRVLSGLLKEREISVEHILVMAGSNGSRFDHTMAIVATLFKACDIVSVPVVVVWGKSLFWLLRPGHHRIQVPPELSSSSTTTGCGLVPVGHPTTVTTTGLKWNIDNQVLAFGKLVSTCNTYELPSDGGEVTVTTSNPLLWTMEWMAESDHSQENTENGF